MTSIQLQQMGDKAVIIEAADLTLLSLSSNIAALDAQVLATKTSQKTLNTAIEQLAEFLRTINDHDEPADVSAAVRKLNDSQRRVVQLSARLTSLTDRLGALQRAIARETHQHKIGITQKLPEKPAQ
ncbi:snpn-1 [Pristionchus pacificus]|uniref:Biogenesis of lysosome-related organelles complex 1 subunit 7 n=1 Tax=Pristionchus pacificus TaxID=54126 RepID=A0A2A6BI72_PRIPA|nr:snpn-1 [Pristionchus pacificus]|eukprot:PDM65563.1 snpn-1 [Pristionchus pacificus]